MPEGALLEQPVEPVVDAEVVSEETLPEQPEEVPSVFSITNRYLIGRLDVSPPAEDGSRVMRCFSGNGAVIVELNLSPQLCAFASLKLAEVEVVAEEEAPDAGSATD